MSYNDLGTPDEELRVSALNSVSEGPSRCLAYGHMSRSAKRVGNHLVFAAFSYVQSAVLHFPHFASEQCPITMYSPKRGPANLRNRLP